MKFGVNTWVWVSPTTIHELNELAPKVKTMGFDIIEIGIENPDDLDYHAAVPVLEANELEVTLTAAMSPDRDLIHPDESVQQNAVDYIRHCVDASEIIGSRIIAGPIYSAVGRTWQQTVDERARDLDTLVHHLKSLSQYAGDHGVTLCIEPLNRFETSFINVVEQGNEVIDRVDHPNCKLLLDTFHMNIEEKSLGNAIRQAGNRVGHFHACENDRGAPGSGNVTWDDVAQGLRDIHYDGAVVIESFTDKVKSIARAAAIWRSFEPSQDALAENGLKFLKTLLS